MNQFLVKFVEPILNNACGTNLTSNAYTYITCKHNMHTLHTYAEVYE